MVIELEIRLVIVLVIELEIWLAIVLMVVVLKHLLIQPRSTDSTVGFRRILWEKLSDLIGSDRNSSEVVGNPGIGFRQEVVGMIAVPAWIWSFRHFPTSDNFLSESDTRVSYNFRRIPIWSGWAVSPWVSTTPIATRENES